MSEINTSIATTATGAEVAKKPQTPQQAIKAFFTSESVKNRFSELLGSKSQGFVTSLLQVVNSNKDLSMADANTIYQSAMMAATLDLPINQNLGFAWIIAYNESFKNSAGQWDKRKVAQFQMGWRGFVQLAMRSGQYSRLNVVEVFANQFKSYNIMTEELDAEFGIDGDGEIVGYAAYIRLLNGFEKTAYWSKTKVIRHAEKYSQAYKGGKSPWNDKDQFHEMAKKTVLKNTLSKWGILSIEMQKAVIADQAIVKDAETVDVDYVDHTEDVKDETNPVHQRIALMIEDATSEKELKALEKDVPAEMVDLFTVKMDELKAKK